MLLKGTVRGYDAEAGTAEVELIGSHGAYITVPVATHLDDRSVADGKRCAVLSFDANDQGDAVLVATYDEPYAMAETDPMPLVDHSHVDVAGEGGQLEADEALLATGITDGKVLTAVGDDSVAWEVPPTLANHDHTGDAGDGGQLEADEALLATGITAAYLLTAVGNGTVAWLPTQPMDVRRGVMLHGASTVITGNPLAIFIDVAQLDNHIWAQSAPANGDVFSNGCYLVAGTYTLYMLGVTNTPYGRIDITLDGVSIASLQDWYSNPAVKNVVKSIAALTVTTGWHKLVCTVNGKHASSSGYYIGLTKMWFKQSAD